MSMTQLATHVEFVGGIIKIRFPQNIFLKRDKKL